MVGTLNGAEPAKRAWVFTERPVLGAKVRTVFILTRLRESSTIDIVVDQTGANLMIFGARKKSCVMRSFASIRPPDEHDVPHEWRAFRARSSRRNVCLRQTRSSFESIAKTPRLAQDQPARP